MTSDTLDAGFNEALDAPRFAGFGIRLGAYVLDILCLIPLIGATVYFTSFSPNATAYLGLGVLMSLYKPIMEGLYGATLGKMITKLKIVQAGGEQIDMQQAFIRWLPFLIGGAYGIWSNYSMISAASAEGISGYMEFALWQQEYMAEQGVSAYLGSALGFIPLISAFFIFGNNRKQAAHDTLAKTFVVYKNPKVA